MVVNKTSPTSAGPFITGSDPSGSQHVVNADLSVLMPTKRLALVA